MVRIIVADDHNLVRKGLVAMLRQEPNFELVGEASDGLEALQLTEKLNPEVLLLDLGMPRMHGLEVIRRVRGNGGKTNVIVVSMLSDDPYVAEALRAGASGYVLKDGSPEELTGAINAVSKGNHFLSPRIKKCAMHAALGASPRDNDPYHDLTERERVVLQHAAEGFSNAEIGQKLFISSRTVESHRANLMKKLNLTCQTDLVRFAIRRKIITA
jgi:two-component system, NarL family, response regulator NreC